jgi:hypothetical protein
VVTDAALHGDYLLGLAGGKGIFFTVEAAEAIHYSLRPAHGCCPFPFVSAALPAAAGTPRARHQEVCPDATATLQALQLAARVQREAVKNKAYRAFPLGQEAGAYLRQNRGRLLPNTYKTYDSCLDKLARYFADLELRDFEPPAGKERLEEFVDEQWGESASRTRAKNISAQGFL